MPVDQICPLGRHGCVLFCSLCVSGSASQFVWIWPVAIHHNVLDIQRVESIPPPHATGRSLSEHIAAHSHFNKSIHHVSVFGSLFIFNYWAHTDTLVPAVLQENTFI